MMGSRQLQNLFWQFSISLECSEVTAFKVFMFFPHIISTFFSHGFLPFPSVLPTLQDATGVLGATEVEKL